MSQLLYVTADTISAKSGGGLVTKEESTALQSLGPCTVWGRDELQHISEKWKGWLREEEPWIWDDLAYGKLDELDSVPKLTHFYAGTWTKTIARLKSLGSKVVFTAAAHSISESLEEHLALDLPFNYPHLTDPELWAKYVGGYVAADVVVCPSSYSADVMSSYGCMNVYVIPHGVDMPERVYPMPKKFVVGYMGSYAADKGVRYLLEAWKRLNWKDAELVLAGRDSRTAWVTDGLIGRFGGGNIRLMGWVDNISDFYKEIQCYVQPASTEGFGCEVLEAMAAGRHVICSTGAGAADVVDAAWRFEAGDVDDLMEKLTLAREADFSRQVIHENHYITKNYTWDKIRELYCQLWRSLLK